MRGSREKGTYRPITRLQLAVHISKQGEVGPNSRIGRVKSIGNGQRKYLRGVGVRKSSYGLMKGPNNKSLAASYSHFLPVRHVAFSPSSSVL